LRIHAVWESIFPQVKSEPSAYQHDSENFAKPSYDAPIEAKQKGTKNVYGREDNLFEGVFGPKAKQPAKKRCHAPPEKGNRKELSTSQKNGDGVSALSHCLSGMVPPSLG